MPPARKTSTRRNLTHDDSRGSGTGFAGPRRWARGGAAARSWRRGDVSAILVQRRGRCSRSERAWDPRDSVRLRVQGEKGLSGGGRIISGVFIGVSWDAREINHSLSFFPFVLSYPAFTLGFCSVPFNVFLSVLFLELLGPLGSYGGGRREGWLECRDVTGAWSDIGEGLQSHRPCLSGVTLVATDEG